MRSHTDWRQNIRVEVITADITTLDVDAIVNAANEQLAHGGGVAAAIARAGAPTVDDESAAWVASHGPLQAGETAVTGAGAMQARWVIHVVGPRYRKSQDNAAMLAEAVTACLDRAEDLEAKSLAIPAISAGIFGYPRPEATRVIARTVRQWDTPSTQHLERVLLVGFDAATAHDFRSGLTGTE